LGATHALADHAQSLVARAKGEARTVDKTAREARADLQAANDELECSIEAVQSLKAELKRRESELADIERKLGVCVQAVIKSDPATLEFLRHFREYLEPSYLRARIFFDRQPLFHPEGLVKGLIGINITAAEKQWDNWAERLTSDPDADATFLASPQ
jgi:hypothetical protein